MSNDERTRVNVAIPTELYTRFREIYPQYGALTWFVNSTLEAFVEVHEVHPDDHVREAVRIAMSLKGEEGAPSAD